MGVRAWMAGAYVGPEALQDKDRLLLDFGVWMMQRYRTAALRWYNGVLVPNSELGHLEMDGQVAERRASNQARERDDLSYEEWAERLQVYYATLELLFSPDLFVVGGGISKKADRFLPLLDLRTEIIPATLRNKAGVVGAALHAAEA